MRSRPGQHRREQLIPAVQSCISMAARPARPCQIEKLRRIAQSFGVSRECFFFQDSLLPGFLYPPRLCLWRLCLLVFECDADLIAGSAFQSACYTPHFQTQVPSATKEEIQKRKHHWQNPHWFVSSGNLHIPVRVCRHISPPQLFQASETYPTGLWTRSTFIDVLLVKVNFVTFSLPDPLRVL